MDFKKLLQTLIPAAHGINRSSAAAQPLCAKYGLLDTDGLSNILVTIEAFRAGHVDIVRDDDSTERKLGMIHHHLEAMVSASQAIADLEPSRLLGGSLVALNDFRCIFETLEMQRALHVLGKLELSEPCEPAAAMLEGFVIPLGEFWYATFGVIPDGHFGSAVEYFAPVEGTAAAFVVEALASTSWKFTNDRIRTAFQAMQANLSERW